MTDYVVVMGVSGCGKSSIGAAFAKQIAADFIDGDELHPSANIAKMAAGLPLDDSDRAPWLALVGLAFSNRESSLVIACSALKRHYRDIIRKHADNTVIFVHLDGPYDVIAARMSARTEHFMPTSLLDSQFAVLEPLGPDEAAVVVDIDQSPDAIVEALEAHFQKETS